MAGISKDEVLKVARLARLELSDADVVKFQEQLSAILEAVSKARNVQVILNQDSAVVWAVPGFDLTADVIEKLKTTPAPAPAKP